MVNGTDMKRGILIPADMNKPMRFVDVDPDRLDDSVTGLLGEGVQYAQFMPDVVAFYGTGQHLPVNERTRKFYSDDALNGDVLYCGGSVEDSVLFDIPPYIVEIAGDVLT